MSAAAVVQNGRGKLLNAVIGTTIDADAKLSLIVKTSRFLGAGLGLGKGGQKHGGQKGDDGDDYQQLN